MAATVVVLELRRDVPVCLPQDEDLGEGPDHALPQLVFAQRGPPSWDQFLPIFTDFYRFFGLPWETSTMNNYHSQDSRD